MRDPAAYRKEKRNDPYSLQQKSEHPYDFVSLPVRPGTGFAVGHETYPPERWSGVLTLVYETRSPLHVGSGGFDLDIEARFGPKARPVRGIVRRLGQPVLPGASWKGAIRNRFEAITASTLGVVGLEHNKVKAEKVPRELKANAPTQLSVKLTDPRLRLLEANKTEGKSTHEGSSPALGELCPAQSLFGAMGYRGRIRPEEGEIYGPPAHKPLSVVPQESPQPHRLAKPGRARAAQGGTIRIDEVEGRKFYYDGPIVHRRAQRDGYEEVDFVPEGSTITIRIHLESLTTAEIGALLVAAGAGPASGVVRFGGYKAAGLGKVALTRYSAELARGPERRPWQRAGATPLDLDAAITEALGSLVDRTRLAELHRITTHRRDQEGAP